LDVPPGERKLMYVVNEAAAKRLGFNPEEIIGRKITTGVFDIDSEVVGVVEDFHVASLHEAIGPVVLMILPQYYYTAGIKVSLEDFDNTLTHIESTWEQLYPEYYYEYEFLDDHLADLYQHDNRTFTLFKIFSGISIFIGCLGLYGLITFMAGQKLKEVGIRKVMGASVSSIMILFGKEFVKLVFLAFLLAAPLAWYAMNSWLEEFAYRVPISWTVFAIGIVSTLVIAVLTVSYRSAQAAITNPAETLRTE
jgi:ABC-type antimicrobial peptide transport system permease subunit